MHGWVHSELHGTWYTAACLNHDNIGMKFLRSAMVLLESMSSGRDLVALNPQNVFVPPLHGAGAVDSLNESLVDWCRTVCKGAEDNKTLTTVGYVHVRECEQVCADRRRLPASGSSSWMARLTGRVGVRVSQAVAYS